MSKTLSRRRKIIYLSGTRADFGLMQSTLQRLAHTVDLSIAVTGMHLDFHFGNTIDEIHTAGLRICGEVKFDVTTRTPQSTSLGISECLKGVTNLLSHECPDVLLLLGDRGEMLAGAIAALNMGIVCVHIHGGERSGTIDEPIRHAISKLSHFHCVATQDSRQRLERMGEFPDRIRVTGAPGLDGLNEIANISREQLMTSLNLIIPTPGISHDATFKKFVLAIFHPVVQEAHAAYAQTTAICSALISIGLPVVWLEPNSDAGSLAVMRALDDCTLPAGSTRIRHLPRRVFCSAMRHCAVLVGNSSAGIIEAATFGTPVVNIGKRQHLRERNANIVDVPVEANEIQKAVLTSIDHGPFPCENLFGDGRAGERIAEFLTGIVLDPKVLEKINSY